MGSALPALLGTSHKTQCKLFTFWLNFLLRIEKKKNIYIYTYIYIVYVLSTTWKLLGLTQKTLFMSVS